MDEFFDKFVKWFSKRGRCWTQQEMCSTCERDEGLKTDHGCAEANALLAPFQNQRPGHDAVQFMATCHEVLQPGQIVECYGPLGIRRGSVKHVDRPSGNNSAGKTEFSTGHVLGHGWIARFQGQ